MIVPLREAYKSSINESLEKIDNGIEKTQTKKSDINKVITAFEVAEELKTISKTFYNGVENQTE